MKDRAVGHRAGQVGAEAAVDRHGELQAAQASAVVKTCRVLVEKRMTLAGDHEIIIPVQPQLDRTPELVGCNGRPHGAVTPLGFLAAKTTAHAAALHAHRVQVKI